MLRLLATAALAAALGATAALAQVEAPPATTPAESVPVDPAAPVASTEPALPADPAAAAPAAPAAIPAPPAAPARPAHCPALSVRGDAVEGQGQRPGSVGFFVRMRPMPEGRLRYSWVVENGSIQGPQNTDFLVARARSTDPVTATVTVTGLPADCPNTAQGQATRS